MRLIVTIGNGLPCVNWARRPGPAPIVPAKTETAAVSAAGTAADGTAVLAEAAEEAGAAEQPI